MHYTYRHIDVDDDKDLDEHEVKDEKRKTEGEEN